MTKLPAWTKKMPKKVTICGIVYQIRYIMERGASFQTRPPLIEVGVADGERYTTEPMIHEISEIIHTEMGTRLYRRVEGDYVFVCSHGQFQNHNLMLIAALRDCGLLK